MLVGEGELLLVGKVVAMDLGQLLDTQYACADGSVLVWEGSQYWKDEFLTSDTVVNC